DAVYAELQRTKQPYVSYGLTVTKVDTLPDPGDRIFLSYIGNIIRIEDGTPVIADQRTIRNWFFVTSISERIGQSGNSVRLKSQTLIASRRGQPESSLAGWRKCSFAA
ncbi:MAG: hypothetical protein AAGK74_13395, partial [Chloroflexota bacterium]